MHADADHDIIAVTDLTFLMNIGVLDFEATWRQTVCVSLKMLVPSKVRKSGGYASYAPVVDHLREVSNSGTHVPLIETFAEMIAAKALEDRQIKAVEVTVQKTDIYPDAGGVGITIYVEQSA